MVRDLESVNGVGFLAPVCVCVFSDQSYRKKQSEEKKNNPQLLLQTNRAMLIVTVSRPICNKQ